MVSKETVLFVWFCCLTATSSLLLIVSVLWFNHFVFLSWRKRQLQFLLEGRGRRAGLSPEELRDNGKLLGEGLSRALFNYPSRDCNAESPEVCSVFCFFVYKEKVLRTEAQWCETVFVKHSVMPHLCRICHLWCAPILYSDFELG